MARSSNLAIAFTLIGTVLSSAAHALGLGAIEAKSALNEPLEARIPLLSVEAGEVESLSIALASSEAFQRAGVDRPFGLTRLKFQVIRGAQPYIRVTTREPVKEPFLDFLVEANWGRGRLVREFTLLLDPPVYGGRQQAPVVIGGSAATAAGAAPAQQPVAAVQPGARPTAAPAQGGIAEVAGGGQYTVRSSDTLYGIAQQVRPDRSVTLNQAMVSLLQANPDAFIDGDMNRLKRGQVLRIPDREGMARVAPAEADRIVRAQVARWRDSQAQASAGPAASDGRLKVVAPPDRQGGEQAGTSEADRDAAGAEGLRRELVLSEEQIASLTSENEELKAQVEALRQEVQNLQGGVNLPGSAPVPVEQPAEQASQPPAQPEPAAAQTEPQAEAVVAEQPQPAEPPAVAPKPVAPKPAQPKAAPGFFDDPMNIGLVAGLGAVLLALGYLIVRRRRNAAEPALVAEVAPVTELPEHDELGLPDAPEAPAEEEFFEEVAEAAPQEQYMPPESDALSEAEVYLAYGRYDQAQDVVAKALNAEPHRTDLRVKLLEILGLVQNGAAFEQHARALRDQVGTSDPAWQRVAEMGRELLPASALFSGDGQDDFLAAEAPEEAPATAEADLDLSDFNFDEPAAQPDDRRAPATAADELDFDLDSAPVEADAGSDEVLDFDLDDTKPAPEPVAADDGGLDFDLDDFSKGESAEVADEAPELLAPEPEAEELPDFRIDEDDAVLEFSSTEEAAPAAAVTDEADLESLDEISTKLDLARAYLDMGDAEGARSLLDEVVEEGNDRQKREATDLIKQIA